MTLAEKQDKIKRKGACFQCLKVGHITKLCKTFVKCPMCQGRHLPIMCPNIQGRANTPKKPESEPKTTASNMNCSSEVLLKTPRVKLVGKDRVTHYARVLLDDGSQRSYIKKKTAEFLHIQPIGKETLRTSLFGRAITEMKEHKKYRTWVFDMAGKLSEEFTFIEEPTVVGRVPKVSSGPWMKELKTMGITLSDTSHDQAEIEILLGSDSIPQILTGRMTRLQCGMIATETIYGWTIQGATDPGGKYRDMTVANTVISSFVSTASIQQLWDLELLGIRVPIEVKTEKQKEEEAKILFTKTLQRNEDGRYVVGLPWIEGEQRIPSNALM